MFKKLLLVSMFFSAIPTFAQSMQADNMQDLPLPKNFDPCRVLKQQGDQAMLCDMKANPVHYAAKANWEYGAVVQGGVGLEERTDFSFFLVGGHLGRVLTPELGTGLFKGNFEYAVEVFPVWQSYTPKFPVLKCPVGATVATQCYGPVTTGGTYRGVSVTPIMLRWNLTHGKRLMPWVQAAGGVVYTTRKYPGVGDLNPLDPTQTGPAADTSVWNFTPQGGIGAHYFVKPKRSVDASVNAVHISSSSLGDKNPGVNVSLQVSVGYTWWK